MTALLADAEAADRRAAAAALAAVASISAKLAQKNAERREAFAERVKELLAEKDGDK